MRGRLVPMARVKKALHSSGENAEWERASASRSTPASVVVGMPQKSCPCSTKPRIHQRYCCSFAVRDR